MTNEWLEFQAYTKKPAYSAASKHDLSYLGRFTFKTITDFEGFGRILTIIARGYLFHNQDGSLREGNPYKKLIIEQQSDGSLIVTLPPSPEQEAIRWILGEGGNVEVLEPICLRQKIHKLAIKIADVNK